MTSYVAFLRNTVFFLAPALAMCTLKILLGLKRLKKATNVCAFGAPTKNGRHF